MNEQTEQEQEAKPAVGRQGWWLGTKRRRAEWQSLSAAGVATFSGRPRANFENAQPGDPVLIYVATPDKAIRAAGVVIKGVANGADKDDAASPALEVQLAFEIPNPLPWRDVRNNEALAKSDPVRNNANGDLIYLSSADYNIVRDMIAGRNPELAASFAALESGEIPPLTRLEPAPSQNGPMLRENEEVYQAQPEEAPAQPEAALPTVSSLQELAEITFLPEAELRDIRDLLLDSRQIVLTGPPGAGKTWIARALAALVANNPANVQVTQFHPSTSYEDFVEGLKPRVNAWGQVTYAVLPGIFARLCVTARKNPTQRFVLIMDEINRAPLARVFGELLYALEYRGPQGTVYLSPSSGNSGASGFYVPENLLLIGTMNSADRSIALVDYALRRRFRFVELEPSSAVLDGWLREHGVNAERRQIMVALLDDVNKRLVDALGVDYQIGHSYFMLPTLDARALDRLWRTALRPLLIEYFTPNVAEVDEYAALFAKAEKALENNSQRWYEGPEI